MNTTLIEIRVLKNSGVLPLKNIRRIGVFGTDADYPSTGSGCGPDLFCMVASKKRYWNGTVTIGGGSGAAYADYIVSSYSSDKLTTGRTS
jgi:beta-glucosidase